MLLYPPLTRPPPPPPPPSPPPLLEDLAGSSLVAAGDVPVRVDEQMMRVNEAARAGEQIPGRQVADGWSKSEGVGGARIKEVTGRSGAK